MKTRKSIKTATDDKSDNKLDRQQEAAVNAMSTQDLNKSYKTISIIPARSSQRLKRKSRDISDTQSDETISGKAVPQHRKDTKKSKSVYSDISTTEIQPKTVQMKTNKADNEPKASNNDKNENQKENLLNENGQNKEYLNFAEEQMQSLDLTSRQNKNCESLQDKHEKNTEMKGTVKIRSDHTYQLIKKKERISEDNQNNQVHEHDTLSVDENHSDTDVQKESAGDEGLCRDTIISYNNLESTKCTDVESTDTQHENPNTHKYFSLLENVDFDFFTLVSSPKTTHARKSLPVVDFKTSSVEKERVPCDYNCVYTPDMVGLEIKDDMIFGPVSAIIKPACKNFIGIVKKTGVRMINKDNSNIFIQGSMKSLIRAETILKEKLHAMNNSSQKTSNENNMNTVRNDTEVFQTPVKIAKVSQTQGINLGLQTSQVTQTSDTETKQQEKITVTMTTSVANEGYREKEMSASNKKELNTDKVLGESINTERTLNSDGEDKDIDTKVSDDSSDKLVATYYDKKEDQSFLAVTEKEQLESKYSCEKCNRKFWSEGLLQAHKDQKHCPNTCQLCGKEFAFKRYLHMHMKRHANIRKFECEFCGWKFLERYKLKLHLESHKNFNERNLPYKCDICEKQFYNKAGWSDHMNTHTGNRPFKCNQCDSSFAHRIGLRRHEVVHSKSKPFKCEHCNKSFPFKSKLDAHLTMHTGVSRYSCQLCGKVYTVSSSLKRHMETCQGKDTMVVKAEELDQSTVDMINANVTDPEAVYMCGICGNLFNSLETASSHTATHESTNNETQPGHLEDTVAYHEIVREQIDPVETQTSCQVIEMIEVYK